MTKGINKNKKKRIVFKGRSSNWATNGWTRNHVWQCKIVEYMSSNPRHRPYERWGECMELILVLLLLLDRYSKIEQHYERINMSFHFYVKVPSLVGSGFFSWVSACFRLAGSKVSIPSRNCCWPFSWAISVLKKNSEHK